MDRDTCWCLVLFVTRKTIHWLVSLLPTHHASKSYLRSLPICFPGSRDYLYKGTSLRNAGSVGSTLVCLEWGLRVQGGRTVPPAGQHSDDKTFTSNSSEETYHKLEKYLGRQARCYWVSEPCCSVLDFGEVGGNKDVQDTLLRKLLFVQAVSSE